MRRSRGFTLMELLIAVGVLSMVSLLIYGAFDAMKKSREGFNRVTDRYREGRAAMAIIARDLQSAYLSQHQPLQEALITRKTGFVGKSDMYLDRLDFVSFTYRRMEAGERVSDQCELSYFGSEDPEQPGVRDLARRVDPRLDLESQKGGRVQVLATNVERFELRYLEPLTGEWIENWDSTQVMGQPNRLPLMVRVTLLLVGGERSASGGVREPLRFTTIVPIALQKPLTFATQ